MHRAPEVALKQPYTEKVDVYSFGIVVWQMATNKVPFKDYGSRAQFMAEVVGKGGRPKLSKRLPQEFNALLLMCWHSNWRCRPSFTAVIRKLDGLIEQHGARDQGDGLKLSSRLFVAPFTSSEKGNQKLQGRTSPATHDSESSTGGCVSVWLSE